MGCCAGATSERDTHDDWDDGDGGYGGASSDDADSDEDNVRRIRDQEREDGEAGVASCPCPPHIRLRTCMRARVHTPVLSKYTRTRLPRRSLCLWLAPQSEIYSYLDTSMQSFSATSRRSMWCLSKLRR